MGMSNNDYNWRLVASEAIPENTVVRVDANGKAAKSTGGAGTVHGICPQAIAAGERCPVMRGGTVSGLSGFSAGTRLKPQGDGTLGSGGANATIAIVKSEDATTAVILTGALDA
jgi:hypothetical protein